MPRTSAGNWSGSSSRFPARDSSGRWSPAPDGTYGSARIPGGLLALNLKTGAVRQIGEAQGLKNTNVRHVAVDHEGRCGSRPTRGYFEATREAATGLNN